MGRHRMGKSGPAGRTAPPQPAGDAVGGTGQPWGHDIGHGARRPDEAQIQSIWLKRADAVSDHQQALTLCWMAGYPQTWAARICLARRIVLPSAADQRRQWADIQHRLGNSLRDPIQGC